MSAVEPRINPGTNSSRFKNLMPMTSAYQYICYLVAIIRKNPRQQSNTPGSATSTSISLAVEGMVALLFGYACPQKRGGNRTGWADSRSGRSAGGLSVVVLTHRNLLFCKSNPSCPGQSRLFNPPDNPHHSPLALRRCAVRQSSGRCIRGRRLWPCPARCRPLVVRGAFCPRYSRS